MVEGIDKGPERRNLTPECTSRENRGMMRARHGNCY